MKKIKISRGNPKNNTSGIKGVDFNKANNVWRARIRINGITITIGIFHDKKDAVKARLNYLINNGD